MSDALSDIAKRERLLKEANDAIDLLAERVWNQAKPFDKKDRHHIIHEGLQIVYELIYDKIEEMEREYEEPKPKDEKFDFRIVAG